MAAVLTLLSLSYILAHGDKSVNAVIEVWEYCSKVAMGLESLGYLHSCGIYDKVHCQCIPIPWNLTN
jgi:hypothetical protein